MESLRQTPWGLELSLDRKGFSGMRSVVLGVAQRENQVCTVNNEIDISRSNPSEVAPTKPMLSQRRVELAGRLHDLMFQETDRGAQQILQEEMLRHRRPIRLEFLKARLPPFH